jgi:flavin reductase (DIM6/NTAB) family NADH-FMN oxidoreductase RutF
MIDPHSFKDMMSSVAQTVTVVTAATDDGPVGLTVSAFTSVSVEPPIVLVCIDKVVSTLDALLASGGYTVSFLPEDTDDVAMVFASHGVDRFGSVGWHEPPKGVGGPILDVAFGHFECRTIHRLDMGDHWVIFAEVIGGGRLDDEANPLVYLKRGFARAHRT